MTETSGQARKSSSFVAALRHFRPSAGFVRLGGVKSSRKRYVDDYVRHLRLENFRDRPTYETGLCAGLRWAVRQGDHVCVVGAGHGITTALAADLAGRGGHVTCYEGSDRLMEVTKRTLAINGVLDRVRLENAIVGAAISVYSSRETVATVDPATLPDCDVLELDCEGAEKIILGDLRIRPRVILVETHGCFGCGYEETTRLLENLGYTVRSLGVAELDKAASCIEKEIYVLMGMRDGGVAAVA